MQQSQRASSFESSCEEIRRTETDRQTERERVKAKNCYAREVHQQQSAVFRVYIAHCAYNFENGVILSYALHTYTQTHAITH